MNKYRLKKSDYISQKTLLLTLESEKGRDLDYFPGQYAAIGYMVDGRPSPVRCFSIVSSPNQKNELQFAAKVYGDFTQSLANLNIGDEMFVYGPFGNFVLDEHLDRNVILLAGGIGITPYISIIRYATEAQLSIPITLLYSVGSQDSIPFYEELLALEKKNPYFKVFFFVTNGGVEKLGPGRIFNTRIEEQHLTQLTGNNYNKFTYFICGPKAFMLAIKEALDIHGTEQSRIITEEFTPTSKQNVEYESPKFSIRRWTYGLSAASLVTGVVLFMTLDITHALNKQAAAEAAANAQTTSSQSQTQNTNSTTTPSTYQQTTQPSQNSTTPYTQSQYQSPVTSVS
ncbi:MAG: ferredoxin--NADP reductase [Candidatus Saccharimonadales bacterium]